MAVAAAVARLAAELQERCRQQGPGLECAAGLAALLGLLAPLSPREAAAMATAVLPAVLQQAASAGGAAAQRQSMGSERERLGAVLRLTLATLQAGLVEAAAGSVSASVALAPLSPPHLLAVLQRGCGDGAAVAPAGTAAVAAAEENRAMALAAGLAAVQAELLDPADMLELLQKVLEDSPASGGSGDSGSGNGSCLAAAALLLPAACCIGGNKDHLLASQPRAAQGSRKKQHQPHHQPPSPLVTAMQHLLGDPGQPPAVLAAVTHGLLCVVSHAHEPVHLTLAANAAAVCGQATGGNSGAYSLSQLLQGRGSAVEAGADFQPSLTASVSEWVRLGLEQLTGAELTVEGQVSKVTCIEALRVSCRRAAVWQWQTLAAGARPA